MRTLLSIILFLTLPLTMSAQTDTVSISLPDSTKADTTTTTLSPCPRVCNTTKTDTISCPRVCDSIADTTTTDTIPKKKQNFFVKAYYFFDRLFSPPRDSNYIDVQNYNWCAELQLTNRIELLDVDGGSDFRITVAPKVRTRIGPFFGWRFAFLGYNIDIKSLFLNNDDMDLGGSIYSSAFGLDLFYRRVGGNYNIRRLTMNGIDYSSLLKGEPFDGINMGMTRISFYYVTNYKHYSHQAAFSQTNRQLRSAGSPILGAAYAHNRCVIDWEKLTNVVNERNNTNYPVNEIFGYMKNDEISFTGGYAYNWVFSKNWLAAAELTGSIGYLIQNNSLTTTEETNHSNLDILEYLEDFRKKYLCFNGNMRLAVLWNNGPWFAGTQGVFFYYQHGSGKITTRNILGTIYFYVGWNF